MDWLTHGNIMNTIVPSDFITDLDPATQANPYQSSWFLTQSASGVSEEARSWMTAQGWSVSGTAIDKTVWPWVTTYTMYRTSMQPWNVLSKLIQDFTNAYNDGRQANDIRYDNIVDLLNHTIATTQSEAATNETEYAGYVTLYLADLDSLKSDYDTFYAAVQNDFTGLDITGVADTLRINNQFDALVSQQRQAMMDRGFYSSAMLSTVEAGIEDKRSLALTELSERLTRLKVDVAAKKNAIYADVLRMRMNLIASKLGLTDKKQELLRYHVDERNKLIVGLTGFMERRTDSYPDMNSIAQLAVGLGEAAVVSP